MTRPNSVGPEDSLVVAPCPPRAMGARGVVYGMSAARVVERRPPLLKIVSSAEPVSAAPRSLRRGALDPAEKARSFHVAAEVRPGRPSSTDGSHRRRP